MAHFLEKFSLEMKGKKLQRNWQKLLSRADEVGLMFPLAHFVEAILSGSYPTAEFAACFAAIWVIIDGKRTDSIVISPQENITCF